MVRGQSLWIHSQMRLEDLEGDRCAWCGSEFEPRDIRQQYCSATCRARARSKRERVVITDCNCPWCGIEFEPVSARQKYCSRTCQKRSNEQRERSARFRAQVATLQCTACGGTMLGIKRTHARYCLTCRRPHENAQQRRRYRERVPLPDLRCVRCGSAMPMATRIDKKFCSSCQQQKRNDRRRRAREKQRERVSGKRAPQGSE